MNLITGDSITYFIVIAAFVFLAYQACSGLGLLPSARKRKNDGQKQQHSRSGEAACGMRGGCNFCVHSTLRNSMCSKPAQKNCEQEKALPDIRKISPLNPHI